MAYPMDFGPRSWNNPTVWADNPKNVSPAWTNIFSQTKQVAHTNFKATEPNQVTIGTNETTFFYTSKLSYDYDEFPTFTSFTIDNITYHSQPPIITLAIARPDGREILLYRHVVLGPSPSETMPISRYTETPHRVYLSGDNTVLFNITDYLRGEFDLDIAVPKLRGIIDKVIFGTPGGEGQDFSVLQGKYNIITTARTYHPDDSIGEVSFVLGGSVYGFMGTDATGRDLAVGLLFGFPIALLIGLTTAILTTIIGTSMGIVSGYTGGKTDTIIQRFCDILANVPLLPILIFLAFIIGQKLWLVVLILILFGWPGLAILVRSMVLHSSSTQLVEATRALGASRWRIMFRHVFFQIAPFILAQMIFFTPAAILAEAGLSFLGLGDPSLPTWGQILESGFSTGAVYAGYWWWVLPPGLLVVLAAMTFVLLALGIEPVVNPKLRQ
ncbi:MAG: ABC transporter permease [Dehalococcoidales bacterium]|nr:ABC transporter permease [Dehalococcoidales bacterium]